MEARSQLDIASDIADSLQDVVRTSLQNYSLRNGSLPLEQAAQTVACARELITAAARAVVQPRSVYRSKKPADVSDSFQKYALGRQSVAPTC